MAIKKILFLLLFLLTAPALCALSLTEKFKQVGYVEICNNNHGTVAFDALYAYFDELIEFLHKNPSWAQKLYSAKERFIRTTDRNYYATDFFGFYDESARARHQIAFYYSTHFHHFLFSHYAECTKVPEIINFFEACCEIQEPYAFIFNEAATELGIETIFSSSDGKAPILLKVIKYLSSYDAPQPHYDGTAFSLFLDSTDNESLLISPYKTNCTVADFSSPFRKFSREWDQNSLLLIPGSLLTEFDIYPTPHFVAPTGTSRYATIAFAMRPHYQPIRKELAPLPNFKH